MASLLEGEKQLFEKFWRGTFKAVAMPRPESVIIASIVARRAATKLETSVCLTPKTSDLKPEPGDAAVMTPPRKTPPRKKKAARKSRVTHRARKHRRRHRSCSVSFDADISPGPAAKRTKKKKSSKRKRRRERSRSCSPSPLRKKKKKKKGSKKSKQHRSASKQMQHSTSHSRRKRKENGKKHKKRSQSDSHRRHRSRRTDDRSPGRRSLSPHNSSEDADTPDHSSCALGNQRRFGWGTAVKLASETPSRCYTLKSECSVKCFRPGLETLNKTAIVQDSLSNQGKEHADYDSGNDTSSPPSAKTGMARAEVVGVREGTCRELASLEKLRFTNRDSASDSGNSLTSYDSACEAVRGQSRRPRSALHSVKREESRSCSAFRTLQQVEKEASRAAKILTPSHHRYRSDSRSRSRTRASRRSPYRDSYSRSRSLSSSPRSYCRSSSYSLDSRRGSVCSSDSGRSEKRSRHAGFRFRDSRSAWRSHRKQSKRDRKKSRKRFSSPVRKKRRASPSHLEARRITSARKRPIPYYRPSPSSSSSSSSSSSLSSWSLFSITRSRSSHRSHSHASSWNSTYSSSRSRSRGRGRGRSRSYDSLASYSRARR